MSKKESQDVSPGDGKSPKRGDMDTFQQLDALVLQAQSLVKQAMTSFESHEERTLKDRYQLCCELLQGLAAVCEESSWSESRLLERIIQPVRNTYSTLESLKVSLDKELLGVSAPARSKALGWMQRAVGDAKADTDLMVVYVALFQMDPNDMKKWSEQLHSIDRALVTRPVYASEDAVQASIRARKNQECVAYACIEIPRKLLLKGVEQRTDRLNQPILSLTNGSVDVGSVQYFVRSGIKYRMQGEILKKIDDNS